MQNFKAIVQYDGTEYQGWQIQANGRTVQGELTRVLSMLDSRDVSVHGSGRTDSGVHAEGQVASFWLERDWDPVRLRDAANGNLNFDIRVMNVEPADDGFHARLSARQKTYRYRVWTDDVVSPFMFRYVYHHRGPLDWDAMTEAAAHLVGTHDFSAFTGAGSDVTDRVRTVDRVDLVREETGFSLLITADGFLRYMVRTIAGTLIDVGRGRREAASVATTLASLNRSEAGLTAPAAGLTLLRVDY
jgi:tRNA pseudouridine38-40 synthase